MKDFLQPATQGDATARVSLTNTAARGLAEVRFVSFLISSTS